MFDKGNHLIYAVLVLLAEFLTVLDCPVDEPADGVAAVSQGLKFAHYPVEGFDLELGVVAEVVATYLIEEVDDLIFYAIRNLLILDKFLLPRTESPFVSGILHRHLDVLKTLVHHRAEMKDLLLGLRYRKFRSRNQTGIDVHQFFRPFFALAVLDYGAYELLDHRNEPDEKSCIYKIEDRMQHRDTVERSLF